MAGDTPFRKRRFRLGGRGGAGRHRPGDGREPRGGIRHGTPSLPADTADSGAVGRSRPTSEAAGSGPDGGGQPSRAVVRTGRTQGRRRRQGGARHVADRIIDIAPRIPVRDLATLRRQFPGLGPEEIADKLDRRRRNAHRPPSARASGAAAMLPVPPAMPAELAAEITGVAADRAASSSPNSTRSTACGRPATQGSAATAYLTSWTERARYRRAQADHDQRGARRPDEARTAPADHEAHGARPAEPDPVHGRRRRRRADEPARHQEARRAGPEATCGAAGPWDALPELPPLEQPARPAPSRSRPEGPATAGSRCRRPSVSRPSRREGRRQGLRLPRRQIDVRRRVRRVRDLHPQRGRDVAAQQHERARVSALCVRQARASSASSTSASPSAATGIRASPATSEPATTRIRAEPYELTADRRQRRAADQPAEHRQRAERQQDQRARDADQEGDDPPRAGRGETFVVGAAEELHAAKLGTARPAAGRAGKVCGCEWNIRSSDAPRRRGAAGPAPRRARHPASSSARTTSSVSAAAGTSRTDCTWRPGRARACSVTAEFTVQARPPGRPRPRARRRARHRARRDARLAELAAAGHRGDRTAGDRLRPARAGGTVLYLEAEVTAVARPEDLLQRDRPDRRPRRARRGPRRRPLHRGRRSTTSSTTAARRRSRPRWPTRTRSGAPAPSR